MAVRLEAVRALEREQAPARRAGLQALRTEHQWVGLRMEDLQALDAWGVFRAHLEKLAEGYTERQRAAEARVLGEAVGDELMREKLAARYAQGYADAVAFVLALPATLQAQAATVEAAVVAQLDTAPHA